jgi:uncharacterized repeat protein (TIGR02543 family)
MSLTTSYVFSTMPSSGITLYAKWTINQYTIAFDVDEGTAVTAITQDYLSAVTAPVAPTKTGYTFGGWYSDISLTAPYVFSTMPLTGITLYAKWTINQYAVEYVDHNATVLQTASYDYGASLSGVTAPADPMRTGYTFNSWSGTLPATMGTSTITITATYTVSQFTITFNSNGGNAIASITQNYATALNAPASPTQAGMIFDGWYSNTGLTASYVFSTMPDENIILYGKWYSNGLAYTLIDGGTHYSVSRGTATGNIVIPAMFNGLPVTAIAANGFDRFGQSWAFTSLTIPEGITTIGMDAFRSLPWTSVTLPSTLITLGNTVFSMNASLLTVHIPANVTGISQQMFSSCTNLQTITVDPDNEFLTSLDGVLFNHDMTTLIAFPNAYVLTTYTVPATVTTIAAFAFRQFSILQTLIFQTGLTTLSSDSISSSTSLQTVYIPLSVTSVANSAIWNCTNLTIRVAATEKPAGWNANWNASNRPVTWSYVE